MQEKKEINLFYTLRIEEDEDNRESDDEVEFVPKERIDYDKYTIIPQNDNLLEFYHNNKDILLEKVQKFVKVFISFDTRFSSYNIRTGNFVKLIKGSVTKCCYLTAFSLIKLPEEEESVAKLEIYLINMKGDLTELIKKADMLVSSTSIWEKLDLIQELIKDFKLERMTPDYEMMKARVDFIKLAERTESFHLFRHPVTERNLYPALDILILKQNEFMVEMANEGIEICLNESNTLKQTDEGYFMYITNHIPREKMEKFFYTPQEKRALIKFAKKSGLSSYIRNEKVYVNYEHLRDPEFNKNTCIYYTKTINFGKICPGVYQGGLNCGVYSFNSQSAGTLLFDLNLKPFAIACYGSFDFYPQIGIASHESNVFLSFEHPGVVFFLNRFLDPKYDLPSAEVFKLKRKKMKRNLFKVERVPLTIPNSKHEDCQHQTRNKMMDIDEENMMIKGYLSNEDDEEYYQS